MSRINTRILRVPGVSGQLDERPMGSFMAPAQAAGEAMAELGDLGQQIAVKEQQLQDTLLANELDMEMASASNAMKTAIGEAKTVEDLQSIDAAFKADFESMNERAKEVQGREISASLAGRMNLAGGKAQLQMMSAINGANTRIAQNQISSLSQGILAEGYASGDAEGAIRRVEELYESNRGVVFSEWDDLSGRIQSEVRGYEKASIQSQILSGEATRESISSAKYLTGEDRFELLRFYNRNEEIASNAADREKQAANTEFENRLNIRASGIADSESWSDDALAVKSEIFEHYKDDPEYARELWKNWSAAASSKSVGDITLMAYRKEDMAGFVDGEIASVRELMAQTKDEDFLDALTVKEQSLVRLKAEAESMTEKEQLAAAQEIEAALRTEAHAVNRRGFKREDGQPHTKDSYRMMLWQRVGEAADAGPMGSIPTREEASRDLGLTSLQYEELHRSIEDSVRDFEVKSMLPDEVEREVLRERPDKQNLQSFADKRLTGDAWVGDLESWMSGQELDPEVASTFDEIARASDYAELPSQIANWFVSGGDLKEKADLWYKKTGVVPGFVLQGVPQEASFRASKVMSYLSQMAGGVSEDEAAKVFNARLTHDQKYALAAARVGLDRTARFSESLTELLVRESRFEDNPEEATMVSLMMETGRFESREDAESLLRLGFVESAKEMALMIAESDGIVGVFAGEGQAVPDLSAISPETTNDLIRKSMGALLSTHGRSRVSPRSRGSWASSGYSAELAFNFRHSDPLHKGGGAFQPHAGGDVMRNEAAHMPMLMAMRSAMLKSHPEIFKDRKAFTKLIGGENPLHGELLWRLMGDLSQTHRELPRQMGSFGHWYVTNQSRLFNDEGKVNGSFVYNSLGSVSQKNAGHDTNALPLAARVDAFIESGMMSASRGRMMTSEELEAENAVRRKMRQTGMNVRLLDEGFLTKFSFHDSDGGIIFETDVVPSAQFGLWDVKVLAEMQAGLEARHGANRRKSAPGRNGDQQPNPNTEEGFQQLLKEAT